MPPVGLVVDIVSGGAFIALAAAVASVGWARPENRLFAVFGGGYGVHFVALNTALLGPWKEPLGETLLVLAAAGGAVAAVALVGLARRAPWPIDAAERARFGRFRHVPSVVTVAYLLAFGLTLPAWLGRITDVAVGVPESLTGHLAAAFLGQVAVRGAILYLGALLALRYPVVPDADNGRQHQLGVLFVALTMYPLLTAGADVGLMRGGLPLVPVLVELAVAVVIAGLWLRASGGPGSRRARNLAWVSLALPLAGMVAVAVAKGDVVTESGLMGISRIAGVAVLAHAILRHQLLGIDVKVRWGISKSTVAAAFIAAFFVASEGAQILFGAENEWIGLLAAGGLVFAIAPLQRAAERLAERAVPVAPLEHTVAPGSAGEEDAFRRAVRWATRDRTLTREEERTLVVIATRLGVPAERAFDIRMEVECEPRSAHQQEVP